MRTNLSRWAVALIALTTALTVPRTSAASCVPCTGTGWSIFNQSQSSFVVMDREAGDIRMVPNIVFSGDGPDFGLIVPTPTRPELTPVDGDIWQDAFSLTAPARAPQSHGCGGLSSDGSDQTSVTESRVTIHADETVGQFHARIISSDDPSALVAWLAENEFAIGPEDTKKFAPYVQRGWFFTAMRLDTMAVTLEERWTLDVEPVQFTFREDELEIPLPLVSINMRDWLPMTVYVVDDHRSTIEGFATTYANRISEDELAAIIQRHPSLASYLSAGRFLTRLDRFFDGPGDMRESVFVRRSPVQDEFRRVVDAGRSRVPVELVLLALPWWWFRRRSRHRR